MRWLLVMLVMQSPVKTDLVFNTLAECLSVEAKVRKEWADMLNNATAQPSFKQRTPEEQAQSRAFMMNQISSGTCIPTK